MIECPNCGKRLANSFTHCRICGSKLNGEKVGDFTTDMLNVFKIDDEYVYLFAEKGNQVILKAGSMDELANMVCDRGYPWEFRDWKGNARPAKRETVEIPELKTEFLKASALKEPEIIPTSSTKRKKDENESYVPEYEVEEVSDEGEETANDSDDARSDEGQDETPQFHRQKDYVESIGDVSFGKIMDRNLTGCVPTLWGPDNSPRARKLRASIFR